MLTFRYAVIGAGVVGLAIARQLSLEHRGDDDVLVIEKERSFGQGVSSRNSEVIHSGIYYPSGSLKHRLCVQGRRLLYQYCADKGVPHRKCGKLVVAAVPDEEPALIKLLEQARANEVDNVSLISREQAQRLEPDVRVNTALFVAETGILDTHAYLQALESDITANNGTVSYGSEATAIELGDGIYRVRFADGEEIGCRCLINAAGLDAIELSAMLGIRPERLYPCKGVYFAYSGKHAVTHLVYPIPERNLTSLGVHATIDLNGRLRFGPDVEYLDAIGDYGVDERRLDLFYQSARHLFPGIDKQKLHPDIAAYRPKIQGPDDAEMKDFYIAHEAGRGYPGFINLLGIESPGLTASLAIGGYVLSIAPPGAGWPE